MVELMNFNPLTERCFGSDVRRQGKGTARCGYFLFPPTTVKQSNAFLLHPEAAVFNLWHLSPQ